MTENSHIQKVPKMIFLTPAMLENLKEMSRKKGIFSLSDLIRSYITQGLEKDLIYYKSLDFSKKHNIIDRKDKEEIKK